MFWTQIIWLIRMFIQPSFIDGICGSEPSSDSAEAESDLLFCGSWKAQRSLGDRFPPIFRVFEVYFRIGDKIKNWYFKKSPFHKWEYPYFWKPPFLHIKNCTLYTALSALVIWMVDLRGEVNKNPWPIFF